MHLCPWLSGDGSAFSSQCIICHLNVFKWLVGYYIIYIRLFQGGFGGQESQSVSFKGHRLFWGGFWSIFTVVIAVFSFWSAESKSGAVRGPGGAVAVSRTCASLVLPLRCAATWAVVIVLRFWSAGSPFGAIGGPVGTVAVASACALRGHLSHLF